MVRGEEERKKALQKKEIQLMEAGKPHEAKLKMKEEEILQLKKDIEQQKQEVKDLKHQVALQEKDLKILNLNS